MSMAVNNVLNTYTYTYKQETRGTLDKNNDSRWDRQEIQNYADAYSSATGKTVDVDKIMEKYAGDDGHVYYEKWDQIYKDDALGFKSLKEYAAAETAKAASASSASDSTVSKVNLDAVSEYVYKIQNQLQPNLDKDRDGYWNKTELENYATAYEKATGSKLDVDSILSKYGNEDGKIGYAAQNKIRDDDALGFKALNKAFTEDKAEKVAVGYENEIKDNWFKKPGTTAGDLSYELSDIMASMSSSGKANFARAISQTDSMSSLLNNFVASNPVGDSMFGMYSAMSQSYNANLYKVMSQTGGSGNQGMYNQLLNSYA